MRAAYSLSEGEVAAIEEAPLPPAWSGASSDE